MADINHKFGKASAGNTYAVATTVKTARAAGSSVLEAYDVSKFSTDTPVFFVTYRKTTDPTTGDVVVTNQVSWKALVNGDVNSFTNLTVAPGYTDTGNQPGDFIEAVPTSFWANSLIEGLERSHYLDGYLIPSAVAASLTGTTLPANTVPTAALADKAVTLAKIDAATLAGRQSFITMKLTTGVDYTSGTMGDWYTMGNLEVPAWATKARVTITIPFSLSASADADVRAVIGANAGLSQRLVFNGHPSGGSYQHVYQDLITLTATGTQALKIQAQRTLGSGSIQGANQPQRTAVVEYF